MNILTKYGRRLAESAVELLERSLSEESVRDRVRNALKDLFEPLSGEEIEKIAATDLDGFTEDFEPGGWIVPDGRIVLVDPNMSYHSHAWAGFSEKRKDAMSVVYPNQDFYEPDSVAQQVCIELGMIRYRLDIDDGDARLRVDLPSSITPEQIDVLYDIEDYVSKNAIGVEAAVVPGEGADRSTGRIWENQCVWIGDMGRFKAAFMNAVKSARGRNA